MRTLIPLAKPGGNQRNVRDRDIVGGLIYILGTGCPWAALPKDLPARSTVNDYFRRWTEDGTLDEIRFTLYQKCRDLAGREVIPTAAIVDAQSVKSGDLRREERIKGGESIDPHGYDAGKKIKGKKRHVVVDTQGLLLLSAVTSAYMQDRDGGILVMSLRFGLFPFLLKLYADGGYQGPQFRNGLKRVCDQINVEIVKRSDAGKFVVLPKRWIVERTIAWLNRCRRLAKDWECLNRNGLAFLCWASSQFMLRKLCKDGK